MAVHSYPSVYQIGHSAIKDIFDGEVIIEEKIDGSQFSFGVINDELVCRSKNKEQIIDAPDKMFSKAIETIKLLKPKLAPQRIYRCEYLEKPHHNALAYDRVPEKNLILFDVSVGIEEYMNPEEKRKEAARIGLEYVPLLFQGVVTDFEIFKEFLSRKSILGGQIVEGVVVKNYALFTKEKKVAMGKYVREEYKEVQQGEWKKNNPSGKDYVAILIEKYTTPARWMKAIQHLKEQGLLENSPKDIGLLMKEIPADVLKECEQEIKTELFDHFWKNISRGITRGLPEWYKEELAKTAFEK